MKNFNSDPYEARRPRPIGEALAKSVTSEAVKSGTNEVVKSDKNSEAVESGTRAGVHPLANYFEEEDPLEILTTLYPCAKFSGGPLPSGFRVKPKIVEHTYSTILQSAPCGSLPQKKKVERRTIRDAAFYIRRRLEAKAKKARAAKKVEEARILKAVLSKKVCLNLTEYRFKGRLQDAYDAGMQVPLSAGSYIRRYRQYATASSYKVADINQFHYDNFIVELPEIHCIRSTGISVKDKDLSTLKVQKNVNNISVKSKKVLSRDRQTDAAQARIEPFKVQETPPVRNKELRTLLRKAKALVVSSGINNIPDGPDRNLAMLDLLCDVEELARQFSITDLDTRNELASAVRSALIFKNFNY